jgi:hypothetical protein
MGEREHFILGERLVRVFGEVLADAGPLCLALTEPALGWVEVAIPLGSGSLAWPALQRSL